MDGFSGKVIFEMIKRNNEIAKEVEKWKDSENLWLQRTSCVSFVKVLPQRRSY